MRTLAARYGLSDVGLAKVCKRLRIPVPGRGYWQKRATGKPVRRISLMALPSGAATGLREVIFSPRSITTKARHEKTPEHRITVPTELTDPHPLVKIASALLRRGAADAQGVRRPSRQPCLDVRVTWKALDRALRVMDALVKTLDARGYPVSVTVGAHPTTSVVIDGESVSFCIEEEVAVVEGQASARTPRSLSHLITSGQLWRQPKISYEATGALTLRITDDDLFDVRRTWADGKRQRVEIVLHTFVAGLVAAAEAKKADRLRREEWNRAWQERERLRIERARRREEELDRVRQLERAVDDWMKSRRIREYIAAVRDARVRAGDAIEDGEIGQWLRWAAQYADRVDPLVDTEERPEVEPDIPLPPLVRHRSR